jgi:3-keto steroid reductase
VATNPIKGVTDPAFKKQVAGWRSDKDGLGWVWQCNTFSHWCIVRSLARPLQ